VVRVIVQLLGFSGIATACSVSPNFWPKASPRSGYGDGLGDLFLTGDTDSLGNGIFAGMVTSPSSSCALSYCGLVSLDLEGLAEGFRLRFPCWKG